MKILQLQELEIENYDGSQFKHSALRIKILGTMKMMQTGASILKLKSKFLLSFMVVLLFIGLLSPQMLSLINMRMHRRNGTYLYFLLILSALFLIISASQYDQMVNLFNPNGDLLQVEYAERASNKGNPLICFTHEINHANSTSNTTETGILLLCRSQPFDQLLDRQSIDKVEKVDDDIWTAFCGLSGDGRSLIRASRSFSSNFRRLFGYAPSVVALAKHIGDTQHEATLKGG